MDKLLLEAGGGIGEGEERAQGKFEAEEGKGVAEFLQSKKEKVLLSGGGSG